jgi:hypothetical protein
MQPTLGLTSRSPIGSQARSHQPEGLLEAGAYPPQSRCTLRSVGVGVSLVQF